MTRPYPTAPRPGRCSESLSPTTGVDPRSLLWKNLNLLARRPMPPMAVPTAPSSLRPQTDNPSLRDRMRAPMAILIRAPTRPPKSRRLRSSNCGGEGNPRNRCFRLHISSNRRTSDLQLSPRHRRLVYHLPHGLHPRTRGSLLALVRGKVTLPRNSTSPLLPPCSPLEDRSRGLLRQLELTS